jgi:RiboL-PSP-HEPN
MPSNSLRRWREDRRRELDEVENAHQSVGGSARGKRHATLQINYSYALLLSANFQGFCRDLHTEAARFLAHWLTTSSFRDVLRSFFIANRKLDFGNPNPGNLGSDFNRFGVDFWTEIAKLSPKNSRRREKLEELNTWRNAIAHHDFSRLSRPLLRLAQVRIWRRACDRLAVSFDRVLSSYLQQHTGTAPW